MKKLSKVLGIVLAMILVIGTMATVSFAEEAAVTYDGPEMELVFSFASGAPEQSQIYVDTCERITARTDGKVKFVYYYGGSLASAYEILDYLGAGMCDLADITLTNFQDRFPYSQQITALPFLGFKNFEMAAEIMGDFIPNNEYCMAEFTKANIYPLFFTGVWGTAFVMKDDVEITGPESLAGLKLMTTTDVENNYILDCGGTPVAQPITELYSSMQNGVIDGAMMGLYLTNIFGALQLAKHVYMLERSFTTGCRTFCINLDKWNEFSPELQQIFLDEFRGEDMWNAGCEYWTTSDQSHLNDCEAWGIPVTYIEGEAMQPWVDLAAPYVEAKLQELIDGGNEHTMEVYEALQAAIENYDGEWK